MTIDHGTHQLVKENGMQSNVQILQRHKHYRQTVRQLIIGLGLKPAIEFLQEELESVLAIIHWHTEKIVRGGLTSDHRRVESMRRDEWREWWIEIRIALNTEASGYPQSWG